MSLGLFEKKFGRSPESFDSLIELNKFVEERLGHRLTVGEDFLDLIPLRGKVLPITRRRGTKLVEAIFADH